MIAHSVGASTSGSTALWHGAPVGAMHLQRLACCASQAPGPRRAPSQKQSRRSSNSAPSGQRLASQARPPPPPPPPQSQQQRPQQHQRGDSRRPGPPSSGAKYDKLIVVEGVNDMQAVRRAVNADVYVLGTATRAGAARVLRELRDAAARYPGGLLLFTDPDVGGRQARNQLDEALAGSVPCWHAFLPEAAATALQATRNHEEGNVGVEHAAPDAIRSALAAARCSRGPERSEFQRGQLIALGLVAPGPGEGAAPSGGMQQATRRRFLVCARLGLGPCDGRQLARQLNRYGFTCADLDAALAWAEGRLGGPGSPLPPG